MELRLTNTDEVTIIDAEDYEKVKDVKWYKDPNGYVSKNLYVGKGKWRKLSLHRMVMDAEKGQIIDHINGNRLDNRKSNLRLATSLENARNARINSRNTSGYKGVTKRNGRYEAYIRNNGILEHLGTYDVLEDAAKAYNVKAVEYFGEFARLNDVDHSGFKVREKMKYYSEYKGVSYHIGKNKWYAALYYKGKMLHIGVYETELEAAKAYDRYAYEVLGDKAHINLQ